MKRLSITATLAVAALLAASTMAMAAQPAPGGVYKGKSTDNDRVTLKVFKNGNKIGLAKVKDKCGDTWRIRRIAIDDRGRFVGKQTSGTGQVEFKVRGRFVSRKNVTGRLVSETCSGERRSYAADLVRKR